MSGDSETNGAGFHEGFDESESVEDSELVRISDGQRDIECAVLAVAEIDDVEYALLAPATSLNLDDEDDGEMELFIFRYSTTAEGVETYEGIEDDATWRRVQTFFATLIDADEDEGEDDA